MPRVSALLVLLAFPVPACSSDGGAGLGGLGLDVGAFSDAALLADQVSRGGADGVAAPKDALDAGKPADPCSHGTQGDGTYCLESLDPVGAKGSTVLVVCAGGVTANSGDCLYGCRAKAGLADDCKPAPGVLCGDGTCQSDEDCAGCPKDCGACVADPCAASPDGAYCGATLPGGDTKGLYVCAGGETQASTTCDLGCKQNPPGVADVCKTGPVCGDGSCGAEEDCKSCSDDCGACVVDPCAGATGGNGDYCAASFEPPTSDPKTLYTCASGVTVQTTPCANGCKSMPAGQNDVCDVPAPADPCAGANNGNGDYCGGSLVPPAGDAATLYSCKDGKTTKSTLCENGCKAMPPGQNDVCSSPPAGDPCAGATLGDGAYCAASLTPPAGDPDTLYQCKAKKTASATKCPNGCFVAPPGVADYCKVSQPTGGKPKGKGVWIWKFNVSAGSPESVAVDADKLGVGFVLIKSGQDANYWADNFNASIVEGFTSKGIWVFGWPYVTPGNLDAKATAIVKAANIPGVKGIILDVEGEFKDHAADAKTLCALIRNKKPDIFLGFSSYGWIKYHLSFPWKEFDQGAGDAHLPQTYWDLWTTGPTGGYQKAIDGVQYLGLKAPIWAAQDNYGGASTAGLNEFFAVAGPWASLWRWPNPSDKALYDQLFKLDWKN